MSDCQRYLCALPYRVEDASVQDHPDGDAVMKTLPLACASDLDPRADTT